MEFSKNQPATLVSEVTACDLAQAAGRTLDWLRTKMMFDPAGTQGVWERVRIDLNQVQYWVRPDCCCEAARCMTLQAGLEDAPQLLDVARNLLTYVQGRQYEYGAFPFYDVLAPEGEEGFQPEGGGGIWPNDNGKVLNILTLLVPVFPQLGLERSASRLGDYFLANQKPEGWWNLDKTDYPGTCFVTWPVAGLARLWKLTGQDKYRAGALAGLEYLKSLVLPGGRLRTSYEINKVENWRPVSSETAMALMAFAVVQRELGIDLSAQIEATGQFLLSLAHPCGAICNCDATCLEASEQNDANLTDLVYTDGYALQALAEAYQTTGQAAYQQAALELAQFLARIQCQGENPLWDGAWRGSYHVVNGQWAGRADQHNPLDEGGMYSVYTGWCALPIATGMQMVSQWLSEEEKA